MQAVWDYNVEELKTTEPGRIFLLERMINFGPGKEKIKLSDVKRYWNKLNLFPLQKKLFALLIWGKYNFQPQNKQSFWMK